MREESDTNTHPSDSPSRRGFLKIMGAGVGLAGMTACRWPKENILPYAHRPAEIVPGNPLAFATSADIAGQVQGLVVTSYDGRPTKIEGNPLHPNNRGRADAYAQASILELYDPDRSKNPVQQVGTGFFDQAWEDWDRFAQGHFATLRQAQGKGLYVLSESSSSPSVRDSRSRLLKACPQARWYEYEPISRDNERLGSVLALGRSYRTHYRFDRAAVVVSLASDFLMDHEASLAWSRDFMAAHTPSPSASMSRLYVAESTYSSTGAMADIRLPVAEGAIAGLACQLAIAVADGGLSSSALTAPLVGALRPVAGSSAPSPFVQAAAKDLLANRGRSIVVVGPGQPPAVHAVAHVLNAALGNLGETVWYTEDPDQGRPAHVQAIVDLVAEMRAQRVQTLLILGGNPVYDAPSDLDFAAALAAVPTRIHLSLHRDETSQACTWHVPRAHYLEAWGDTRAFDGTYAPAQPLIRPLYDGRSAIELLSQISEAPPLSGYEIVRRTLREQLGGAVSDDQFEARWRKLLNDGAAGPTASASAPAHGGSEGAAAGGTRPAASLEPLPAQAVTLQPDAIVGALQRMQAPRPLDRQNLEVIYRPDAKVYDGRFANNGWLQELPDTFTRITWDNAVLMAPATAAALKVGQGEIVIVQRAGGRIAGPVCLMPGQAPFTVVLPLGYGRKVAGNVGTGVGFNAYLLRASDAMHAADGATVRGTRRVREFAQTQDHKIDRIGREGERVRLNELVREMTLPQFQEFAATAAGPDAGAPEQLWPPFEYNGYKWGMSIDLQKCIGCNACTIACVAENNSPIVGRDQVQRNRHMYWLRIDRYFRDESAAPAVSFQPVFCVHCENAPCESVCPVAATVHDHDGLNLMVYNRCVGTRYCSNNCPYKVRRFNFYHYSYDPPLVRRMQYNPEVTVRSRGVMEKCTYCIQRIERAKIHAKNERRAIPDGEFTTACAQTCPTEAIIFGDLNDPQSRVSQLHRDKRSYALLKELNTRPRSLHMVRVRNPGGTV